MRISGGILLFLAVLELINFHEYVNIAAGEKSVIVEIPVNQTESFSQSAENIHNIKKPNFKGQKELLKTYIVHVHSKKKPASILSTEEWHHSLLASASAAATAKNINRANNRVNTIDSIKNRLVYSYSSAMQGFAARLTKEEAEALHGMEEVNMILEDALYELQTTRTPSFLGLFTETSGLSGGPLFEAGKGGRDVIIGVLDSGIWPERRSFNDNGFTRVPERWKGGCDNVPSFRGMNACNRKLIGARAFYKGIEDRVGVTVNEYHRSPRDHRGHGTHTASIAAGNFVRNASVYGYAPGTASGMAPNARLAVYKVCWDMAGCAGADILAAFDAAIIDGVDLISLSLALSKSEDSYMDAISVGAFAAAGKGILSVAGTGNSGPLPLTVLNAAPWILTVAGSTLDRDFPATVKLGNGATYEGVSRISDEHADLARTAWPLVDGDGCEAPRRNMNGAVVLCWDEYGASHGETMGLVVQEAGGVGVVYVIGKDDLSGTPSKGVYTMPTVVVGKTTGNAIDQYLFRSSKPTVKLGLNPGRTRIGSQKAPSVAPFSSRGPNKLTWELMKPDVTAPAVGILAAWVQSMEFNINSGTSMSAPHVAGVAALLKAARPTWSPAMIQSAIITTANTLNNRDNPIADLATGIDASPVSMGAGHINPNAALDPGLVYNSTLQDYIDFLCSIGYDSNMVGTFTNPSIITSFSTPLTCTRKLIRPRPRGDLNYPSFSVVYRKSQAQVGTTTNFTFSRILTNVNTSKSIYTVNIVPPPNVQVIVEPNVLLFTSLNQELSYSITFTPDPSAFNNVPKESHHISSGSISWEDGPGGHKVRSPIMFTWFVDK